MTFAIVIFATCHDVGKDLLAACLATLMGFHVSVEVCLLEKPVCADFALKATFTGV